MSDGAVVAYAFLEESSVEVALPVTGDALYGVYTTGPLVTWQERGDDPRLFVWNAATLTMKSCPFPAELPPGFFDLFLRRLWRPDGGAFLASGRHPSGSGVATVVSVGADRCEPLAGGLGEALLGGAADFSSDSRHLAWLGQGELWVADGDGRSARLVARDPRFELLFVPFSRRAVLAGPADVAKLWTIDLDGAAAPALVAQGVFGLRLLDLAVLSDRWLAVGTDLNTQDQNGTLSLIDTESGKSRSVARSVITFLAEAAGRADDGVETARVAYVRRGRFASDRDGVWTATLRLTP
jgi:hypothetical protein